MSNLVFAPEQLVGLVVDTGVHKVHVVVLDAEVQIPKPDDQPGPRQRQRGGGRKARGAVDE